MSTLYIFQAILQGFVELLGRIDSELVAFVACMLNFHIMGFAVASVVVVRHFTKLTTEEILALKY